MAIRIDLQYGLGLLNAWLLITLMATSPRAQSQAADDSRLAKDFSNGPSAASPAWPRTWWHWTNGNITHDGITKDLEWMQRAGIGGFHLADVAFGRGQEIEQKLEFGSEAWYAAVRHTAEESKRLGLEMTVFSSAGWSLTGGPWVQPGQAMKKLVWSELTVEGPRRFSGALPQPPDVNGPFRNMGRRGADPTHYGDSAVLAFRTPAADLAPPKPSSVTANGSPFDAAALLDDDLNSAASIPAPEGGGAAWLQYEYAEPVTFRALTLVGTGRGIPVGRVLAGSDGQNFQPIVALPGAQLYRQGRVRTFAFEPVTVRFFRIELTGAPLDPAATMSQAPPQPASEYGLAEAVFHTGARVHRWEEKAGFSFLFEYDTVPSPQVAPELAIDRDAIVDLTGRMNPDGTLNWDVPEGHWTIMRFGYSLTGAKNRPAVPSGLGYEVDKLSREHATAYYREFGGALAEALGDLNGVVLQYWLLDSWEAGMQNWTERMIAQFEQRRGYDPTPWLPAMTGRVVGSAELSDRFLWDFRRTLADMYADNFYAVFDELLGADGIGTYSEAAGVSLEIPEDTLLNKSKVDIPMGEFWQRDLHPRLMYYQDVRGAASAAHIYGKRIVATESFTGGGYESPYSMKQVADYWFAQGLNQIVFHTSAHQPLDAKPGNTMVGTHIHRNITWAEQARPFMQYIARNSMMLQEGLFVADLVYLLDEGAPSTMKIWGSGLTPEPPAGHDFDYINVDALMTRMNVDEDGRLVLPDGMSYGVLVLPDSQRMRPEVVRKIAKLVAGGATVTGPRPLRSPSLMGHPSADGEVRTAALEAWGDLDGESRTIHRHGKGRMVWGLPLSDVLADAGIAPDFEYAGGLDTELAWLHRRSGPLDIYYVANVTGQPRQIEARFRVTADSAQIWHPVTGRIDWAGARPTGENATVVDLAMQPHDAVYVVFGSAASPPPGVLNPKPLPEAIATLEGPWTVSFAPDMGAPESITMDTLASWTGHDLSGVKFYSGTAAYTRTFMLDRAPESGERWSLNLGGVHDIADVTLNGQRVGTVWCPPYAVDVSRALRAGENSLEVRVTNQWTNRITGDGVVPEDERVLGGGAPNAGRWGGRSPAPAVSGLLGPVKIEVLK